MSPINSRATVPPCTGKDSSKMEPNTLMALRVSNTDPTGLDLTDLRQGITQCGITPGQSMLYNFTVTGQFGTFCEFLNKRDIYQFGLQSILLFLTRVPFTLFVALYRRCAR